jgi:hypothetical protein
VHDRVLTSCLQRPLRGEGELIDTGGGGGGEGGPLTDGTEAAREVNTVVRKNMLTPEKLVNQL